MTAWCLIMALYLFIILFQIPLTFSLWKREQIEPLISFLDGSLYCYLYIYILYICFAVYWYNVLIIKFLELTGWGATGHSQILFMRHEYCTTRIYFYYWHHKWRAVCFGGVFCSRVHPTGPGSPTLTWFWWTPVSPCSLERELCCGRSTLWVCTSTDKIPYALI